MSDGQSVSRRVGELTSELCKLMARLRALEQEAPSQVWGLALLMCRREVAGMAEESIRIREQIEAEEAKASGKRGRRARA